MNEEMIIKIIGLVGMVTFGVVAYFTIGNSPSKEDNKYYLSEI